MNELKRLTRGGTGAALVAAALTSGCEEQPSVEERVGTWVDAVQDLTATSCDCYDDFGYGSRTQCLNENITVGPGLQRCLGDALARDEAAAHTWLDCSIEVQMERLDCYDARLVCGDFDSVAPCDVDYDVANEACIQLPPTIQRGVEDCFDQLSPQGEG